MPAKSTASSTKRKVARKALPRKSVTRAYAAQSPAAKLAPFQIERRELRPRDVQLEILFCGVCHSDIHMARNEWKQTSYPVVPGHEIVGHGWVNDTAQSSLDTDSEKKLIRRTLDALASVTGKRPVGWVSVTVGAAPVPPGATLTILATEGTPFASTCPGTRLLNDPSTVRSPCETRGLGIWFAAVPMSVAHGSSVVRVRVWRSAILIGFCGGFTTFSALAYESFELARTGDQLRALLNLAAHVTLGIAAVWAGYVAALKV